MHTAANFFRLLATIFIPNLIFARVLLIILKRLNSPHSFIYSNTPLFSKILICRL